MLTVITIIDGEYFDNCVFNFMRRAIYAAEGITEDFSEKVTFESIIKEKEFSQREESRCWAELNLGKISKAEFFHVTLGKSKSFILTGSKGAWNDKAGDQARDECKPVGEEPSL